MFGKSTAWAFAIALVLTLGGLRAALGGDAAPSVSGAAPPASAPSEPANAPAPAPTVAADPAPAPAAAPPEDDRLRAYVLTFSPGDHPFYKFGHNAIWIHDETKPARERDKVYNWGTFTFGDPALLPKFVQGRFMYWLSVQGIGATQFVYKRENRSITAQELDLDYAQVRELQRLVDENAKPENKHYKYDYYRDNCSTRVRDMIDKVTGGRVHEVTKGPGRLTYRQHTLRLTESMPAEYVALNLVMGDLIDKPVTEWDESFVPMEFQAAARKTTLIGPDGVERPLVKREWVLLPSVQTPPPNDPPTWWPYSLAAGLASAAVFALAGRAGKKSKLARVLFGLSLSFWGLIAGFFGFFFLAVWFFTDHAVGYGNENLMLCAPWGLWLVGTGVRVALGRAKSMVFAKKLLTLTLGVAVFATVAKILPWFDQQNGFFLVFFVPLWAGALFGARELATAAEGALAAVSKQTAAENAGLAPETAPAKPAKKPSSKKPKKAALELETDKSAAPQAEGGGIDGE
jgi:hypothetical protein